GCLTRHVAAVGACKHDRGKPRQKHQVLSKRGVGTNRALNGSRPTKGAAARDLGRTSKTSRTMFPACPIADRDVACPRGAKAHGAASAAVARSVPRPHAFRVTPTPSVHSHHALQTTGRDAGDLQTQPSSEK